MISDYKRAGPIHRSQTLQRRLDSSNNMKLGHCRLVTTFLLLAIAFVSAQPRTPNTPTFEKSETRCGWFSNPTPANASLYDRDGEWIIGVQGGYQAEGDWPDFSAKQWIETNVHYGYGCACLRVQVDRSTERIIKIESSRPRPLSVCRRDRALRKWGFK